MQFVILTKGRWLITQLTTDRQTDIFKHIEQHLFTHSLAHLQTHSLIFTHMYVGIYINTNTFITKR